MNWWSNYLKLWSHQITTNHKSYRILTVILVAKINTQEPFSDILILGIFEELFFISFLLYSWSSKILNPHHLLCRNLHPKISILRKSRSFHWSATLFAKFLNYLDLCFKLRRQGCCNNCVDTPGSVK